MSDIPPLYDEEKGLREVARARLRRDGTTRAQVVMADLLAEEMQRHFSAEETETAGRALLIGTAACGALAAEKIPATVILNIIGFTAGRLIADGPGVDRGAAGGGAMIRRRVHAGCGIRNPVRLSLLWMFFAVAQIISWPTDLLTGTLWGLLGYLPWLTAIAVSIRWGVIHSPRKMYRTWYP